MKLFSIKKAHRIAQGVVFCLFVSIQAVAQEPDFLFEQTYPYPIIYTLRYEAPLTFTLQLSSDDESETFYLVSVSDQKNWYYETDSVVFQPIVYKVSEQGEILGELALGYEERYALVSRLFDDPNDAHCSLAIGKVFDTSQQYDRPFIAKFDHDLNLLWQREIELPESYRKYLYIESYMDSDGNIICYSSPIEYYPYGSMVNVIIYRLTPDAELDILYEYPYLCDNYLLAFQCGDIFEYQDGSGDYGCFVREEEYQMFLVRLNRQLELVSRQSIPMDINEPHSCFSLDYLTACFPLSDGTVVAGGDAYLAREDYNYNWVNDRVVGFIRIDSEGSLVSYATVGEGVLGIDDDSIRSMQGEKCTDMVGDDAFYFYYMVGGNHGFDYDWINSFVVVKMGIEGDVIWKRYWNRYYPEYGMKVYYPNAISTTSDDGCLVTGYCYYSDIYGPNPMGSDPEIFLLKFFSDGTFSVPEAEAFIRPYMFYPNPAQYQLQLKYSPDVQPKQVELYDLQGHLVRTQQSDLENIDIHGLATGQYLMKVTLEDGKVYSDKVVKE